MNFDVLISKLQKTNVPQLIRKFLGFMFNDSFVNEFFNGEIGVERKIGNGARQGDVLSQILFNFYFNDAIERTLELKAVCKLDAKSFNFIGYADNIALLGPSKTALQLLIDNMSEFLAKINLFVNVEKISYIVFQI